MYYTLICLISSFLSLLTVANNVKDAWDQICHMPAGSTTEKGCSQSLLQKSIPKALSHLVVTQLHVPVPKVPQTFSSQSVKK